MTQDVAPEANSGLEPGSIEEQVFAEDEASYQEAIKQKNDSENNSEASEEDKTTEEDNDQSNSSEDEESPEGEESSEEAEESDESEEETPEEEEESNDDEEEEAESTEDEEEPEPKSFKVGGREYSTVEDAIAEANRITGHNANLAGEKKVLEKEKEDLNAKIKELNDANKEWEEWGKDPENAKHPTLDPEKIARKTAEIIREEKELEAKGEIIDKEYNEIKEYSNFNEISSKFQELIHNRTIDPLTNSPFASPKRLYSYLTKEFGLVDYSSQKTVKTVKKKDKTAMQKAASKPAPMKKATKKGSESPEEEESWEDGVLNDSF